ncbi:MAG: hypothetical protein ABJF23_29560 [Bryobacteraceae bacterium]
MKFSLKLRSCLGRGSVYRGVRLRFQPMERVIVRIVLPRFEMGQAIENNADLADRTRRLPLVYEAGVVPECSTHVVGAIYRLFRFQEIKSTPSISVHPALLCIASATAPTPVAFLPRMVSGVTSM